MPFHPGISGQGQTPRLREMHGPGRSGLPHHGRGEGLLARALQHETDHLSGKFYVDRVPLFKRLKLYYEIRKVKKLNHWNQGSGPNP